MNELLDILKKYGEVNPEDVQVQLSQRTQDLARELVAKIKEAARVKEYLTKLQLRINELSYRILPDLFNEQGLNSIGVSSGVILELFPYFKASLPVDMDFEKREEALAYLREKAPEILKTEISVSYGRDEHYLAEQLIAVLRELDIDPKVFEGVHHSTLTSWVKQQFMAGEDVPFKTLNATVGSVVRIHLTNPEEAELMKRLRKLQSISPGSVLDTDSAVTTENKGDLG